MLHRVNLNGTLGQRGGTLNGLNLGCRRIDERFVGQVYTPELQTGIDLCRFDGEVNGKPRVKRRALDGGTLLKCSLHLNSHIVTIFYTIFSFCEAQNATSAKIFE